MKKILFVLCLLLWIFSTSYAKGWDAAYINKLITQGEIDKVIDYYKLNYFSPDRDPKVAFKIADLYARKKDYPAAVEWYEKEKQYLQESKTNLLNLADAYRMVGNYQKALDAYLMYAAETGDAVAVMDHANLCERLIRASSFVDNYFFEPYKYNSPDDESHVSALRGNMTYSLTAADGIARIWESMREYDTWNEPQLVITHPNEKIKYSGISFSEDGNTVVYASKELSAGKAGTLAGKEIGKIYFATYLGGELLNDIPFPFNSDSYSCNDPVLNKDGSILYFSSNMPGGSGGLDIWQSTWVNGKWNKPQNLGKLVNTDAEETAPYITANSKNPVLFFASDREGGFGGLDIYKAEFTDNGWQDVEMQPAPINSPQNENSFVFDPETQAGYVSSDRPGGKGGADIYRVRPLDLKLVVVAIDSSTKEPLDYSYLQLYDNNIKVYETVTGNDGVSVIQLGMNHTYVVNISKDNYRPKTIQFSTVGKYNGDSVILQIALLKDPQFSNQNSTTGISMQNFIVFMGHFTDDATNKLIQPQMRMVNLNTNKLRILDIDDKGSFLIKLMINNNYKIYIEYQGNKIGDEITTYGLDHGSIKQKNYILSGTKFKTTENRILSPELVPDSLKYLWKEEIQPVTETSMVLTSNTDPSKIIGLNSYTDGKSHLSEINSTQAPEQKKFTATDASTTLPGNDPSVSTSTNDLYYKIQIGSYANTTTFPGLEGMGQVQESVSFGNHIYRVGNFTDLNDAKNKLEIIHQKGYNLAFILQYSGDKVISIIK